MEQKILRGEATSSMRLMAAGAQWRASEFTCHAGPSDPAFEEQHEHVTIAAVVEGTFHYHGGSGRALLHPGALLLGNFGSCYECGHDHSQGDRCITFHIAPDYFAEIAASIAGSSRFQFSTAALPALPGLLPWIARIETRSAQNDMPDFEDALTRFVETVIAALSKVPPPRANISARDEKRVADVVRYIELHAHHPIALDDLARVAVMSKYHFLRTFRTVIGMTLYQFLLSMRARRAAVRLASATEPVSTIAYDSGFGDLSTFNARFQDIFGMSPGRYRRAHSV